MKIEQAIDFISSYPGEFIHPSIFGFSVNSNSKQIWGLDWGSAEIVEMHLHELIMWHGSLRKNKLLFRLNNMSTFGTPHVLIDKSGNSFLQDGNHRIACLSLLEQKTALCRVLSF